MRKEQFFLMMVLLLAFASCNKNHYDFDRFEGVEASGDWRLPVSSATRSIGEVISALNKNGVIENDENGHLRFVYSYSIDDAIKGADFMYFKDQQFEETYSFDNPIPIVLPAPMDTVLRFQRTITLTSEKIGVMSADIKSGMMKLRLTTNLSGVQRINMIAHNIIDADGNAMHFDINPSLEENVFDLTGLRYETQTANTIDLTFEVHLSVQSLAAQQYNTTFALNLNDFKLSRMSGSVSVFQSYHKIDSTFSLFPNSLTGSAMFLDAKVKLRERNSFALPAQLRIDTAMILGGGSEPYTIFDHVPVVVDIRPSSGYVEVFNENVSGVLNTNQQQAYSSAVFSLNPDSLNTVFEVADTTSIDTKIDVEIPFKFNVPSVTYIDTVNMNLSNYDSLDLLKEVVLNMLVRTDIPFNISVQAFFYNSTTGEVTETFFDDAFVLHGSFDGAMQQSEIEIALTTERIRQLLHSDKLIVHYHIDTEGKDVELNAGQRLNMALRAKMVYDGMVYPIKK